MPPELKSRLQTDLTTAMKARDAVRVGTIRMALTAVHAEEVAGTSARELSDDEVITVLGREAKKRREAASAFDDAGRAELADRERAELGVLTEYLPVQLSDAALASIVAEQVAAAERSGATGRAAMGAVMKGLKPQISGRADGSLVAAEVRRQLGT